MKEKIIPIVAVLIGLIAFGLTFKAQHDRDERLKAEFRKLYKDAEMEKVMAAVRDIPEGILLRSSDLKYIDVFKRSGTAKMVKSKDGKLLIGRKTLEPIPRNEPIRWDYIEGGDSRHTGLAHLVTPGLRAISLSIGGASAVSGMVRPNDRVDLLGTFSFPSKTSPDQMETVTLTVLQDVTILATGQDLARNMDEQKGRSGGYSTVTLEVTPREAELLVFAQQLRGSLVLTLRHPEDLGYESDLPNVNFEHLENNIKNYNLNRQRAIRHKNVVK